MNRGVRLGLVAVALAASLLVSAEGHAPRSAASAKGGLCSNGPLARPRPDCSPPPPRSTGNPYQDCVARINQLRRACQCLPPLKRWKGGEACADNLAKYDSKRGIHAGFAKGKCEPRGRAQNECPAWPSTSKVVDGCLQAMWDEGPGRRFAKHGHYINMSSLEYEQVACGFARGADGKIWSVQNFR